MQLAEAVAIRRATAGQAGPDPSDEEEQEHEGALGAPPGRARGQQGQRDGQLGQRQEESQRGRKRSRHAKVLQGLPRSRTVGQLGQPGHHEYQGEQHACHEEYQPHGGTS